MKALFTLLSLGLLSAAIIGCEASGSVGDDDDVDTVRIEDRDEKTVKKTTTIEPDGDRTTRTETRIDR